jgi:hypothetical protein
MTKGCAPGSKKGGKEAPMPKPPKAPKGGKK